MDERVRERREKEGKKIERRKTRVFRLYRDYFRL